MPLQSVVSYLPVLATFNAHWRAVERDSGSVLAFRGGSLVLSEALYVRLKGEMEEVQRGALKVSLLRADVAAGRERVRGLLGQLRGMVLAYWDGTVWPGLMPNLPKAGLLLDKFLRPSREGLLVWKGLEEGPLPPGAPSPLLIGPEKDMDRAGYAAEVEALRLLNLELEAAEFSLSVKRAVRNGSMAEVRAMLSGFLRALAAEFPPGDPLLTSAPRLWPLPGHTPEPVVAEGGWLKEEAMAEVYWEKSDEKTLSHYQVRGCAGDAYEGEDERVVANVKPGQPLRWVGTDFLPRPGMTACYRVYVVLKTGNERASNTVVLMRPPV